MDAVPAAVSGSPAASAATGQYLTFELAGGLFAIPILAVQEIRGWEPVSRIPRAPAHVLGVINLRGAVVPVVDLRTRLSIERRDTTSTTVVIVVRIESSVAGVVTVGCVVDAVSDVSNVDAGTISTPPAICGAVDSHFLSGVSSLDSRLVMFLDLMRLIDESVVGTSAAPKAA